MYFRRRDVLWHGVWMFDSVREREMWCALLIKHCREQYVLMIANPAIYISLDSFFFSLMLGISFDSIAEMEMIHVTLCRIWTSWHTDINWNFTTISKFIYILNAIAGDFYRKYCLLRAECSNVRISMIICMESTGGNESFRCFFFFHLLRENEQEKNRRIADVNFHYLFTYIVIFKYGFHSHSHNPCGDVRVE